MYLVDNIIEKPFGESVTIPVTDMAMQTFTAFRKAVKEFLPWGDPHCPQLRNCQRRRRLRGALCGHPSVRSRRP